MFLNKFWRIFLRLTNFFDWQTFLTDELSYQTNISSTDEFEWKKNIEIFSILRKFAFFEKKQRKMNFVKSKILLKNFSLFRQPINICKT